MIYDQLIQSTINSTIGVARGEISNYSDSWSHLFSIFLNNKKLIILSILKE